MNRWRLNKMSRLLVAALVTVTAALIGPGIANQRRPQPYTQDSWTDCPPSFRKDKVCHTAGYDFESMAFNANDDATDLPLVLALHWSSSTPQELLKALGPQTGRFRVVLPYAHHRKRNGYSFFTRDFYDQPLTAQRDQVEDEAARLAAFIRQIQKIYRCGGPLLVTGASQGGDLSFQLAHDHPDLVAAAFPMLGRNMVGRSDSWRDAAPVKASFSLTDPIVDGLQAKTSIDAIRSSMGDAEMRQFVADGHDISAEMATALAEDLDAYISRSCKSFSRARAP